MAKMLEIEDPEELEIQVYNKKMDEGLLSVYMVDFIVVIVNVSDVQIKNYFMKKYKDPEQVSSKIEDERDKSQLNSESLNNNSKGLYNQVCSNIKSLLHEQDNVEAKARIETFTTKFQSL